MPAVDLVLEPRPTNMVENEPAPIVLVLVVVLVLDPVRLPGRDRGEGLRPYRPR
jgi:hypothetical protein